MAGCAVDEGLDPKPLTELVETVLSFFPDQEKIDNLNDRKRRMTLEDLLTMRSGTDYHERGPDSPHDQLNRKSQGWTKFVLDRPMISEPGTTFRYDSGAVILTSAILKARYGVHADRFATEHLFSPLGIDRYEWFKNAEGHPHTGGGLSLRSRDMARFGLLYLRAGRWDGKLVVTAGGRNWTEESAPREFLYSHVLKAVR